MFCCNCGAEVFNSDAFCYRCGSSLPQASKSGDKLKEDTCSNEEDESLYVLLTNEDGKDEKFQFLDLIEYKNREYIVLLPTQSVESETVIILEVINADTEYESYVSVDDSRILEKVFELFKETNKDYYVFAD